LDFIHHQKQPCLFIVGGFLIGLNKQLQNIISSCSQQWYCHGYDWSSIQFTWSNSGGSSCNDFIVVK